MKNIVVILGLSRFAVKLIWWIALGSASRAYVNQLQSFYIFF